ncbi:PAS domain S-box protein [Edaphobacter sp. HDX4]|uniref:PAS domain S-box protein n=1 Tax=Edaphobacter sp. HDX4 TaxID=2794064 RepID=UPI002FE5F194
MDTEVLGISTESDDPVMPPEASATQSSGHIVQFYETDDALTQGLSRFISSALGAGLPAIVIATKPHRDALIVHLQEQGIDTHLAVQQGRFVSLDASESLSRFMVAGEPDPVLFRKVIGTLIGEASVVAERHGGKLAAFGEMVSVLWAEGNHSAALALERLWNELAKIHRFQLQCAYPMHLFSEHQDGERMAEVCAEHSYVIPTERYTSVETEDQRLRTILFLQQKAQALELEVARRERLQAELQEREAELRDYVENALIGMHWVSATGEILWANKAELQLLGYEYDEYVGRQISEFHADAAVIEDILSRLSRCEELVGYEARLQCKDGSIRNVRIDSNVYVRDGKFVHTRCFTTDITEQKQAEKAMASLAAIVESSDDAIVSKDLNGIVTSWNRGAERILGYSADEIIGKSITTIIPLELQEDEPQILDKVRRGERIEHFETVRMHKNGDRLDVSLTISPVRNRHGKIIGAAKILRDVTEQKRLIAALHTSERLASVGRLAATIAHEINNPLESITNLIYLGKKHPEVPQEVRSYLESAEQELRRAAHIAQQTLGFQRATSNASWINVAEVVETIVAIYERKFSYKNVRIERQIQPDLKIFTWAGEFKQILSNLISNALDASREGGRLIIRARVVTQVRIGALVARISIADDGTGISKENQAKIFDPFFTTKELVGTGLGLWITKSLIEKRGGTMQVRSRDFQPSGTVMSFRLPER